MVRSGSYRRGGFWRWIVSEWVFLARGSEWVLVLDYYGGFRRFGVMGFGVGLYQRWGVSAWIEVGFGFGLLDFQVAVVGFGVSAWWVLVLGYWIFGLLWVCFVVVVGLYCFIVVDILFYYDVYIILLC